MDYQIALSPDLGLSAEDFVSAWNETPECRAVAEARPDRSAAAQYGPTLLAGALAVLGGVAINIVSNALYDLIKQALARRGVKTQTEIVQLDRPDGTRLLVVKIVEG